MVRKTLIILTVLTMLALAVSADIIDVEGASSSGSFVCVRNPFWTAYSSGTTTTTTTSTDAVSLLIMVAPILLLYEVGVAIISVKRVMA